MSTIKPQVGHLKLEVERIDADGYALILIGELPKPIPGIRTASVAARYPVTELAAALGLHTSEDLANAWEKGARTAFYSDRTGSDARMSRTAFTDHDWDNPYRSNDA